MHYPYKLITMVDTYIHVCLELTLHMLYLLNIPCWPSKKCGEIKVESYLKANAYERIDDNTNLILRCDQSLAWLFFASVARWLC